LSGEHRLKNQDELSTLVEVLTPEARVGSSHLIMQEIINILGLLIMTVLVVCVVHLLFGHKLND